MDTLTPGQQFDYQQLPQQYEQQQPSRLWRISGNVRKAQLSSSSDFKPSNFQHVIILSYTAAISSY